jgi:hypothetical protein
MRKLFAIPVVAAALLVGLAGPAHASSGHASGTFAFVSDNFEFRGVIGQNLVFAEVAVISYDGDLTGVATDTDTFILHPDGSFDAHGTETCAVCTLAGRHGSYTSTYVFSGAGAAYHGALVVTGGSGGLAGLHGGGPFQGDENGNTYSYTYSLVG